LNCGKIADNQKTSPEWLRLTRLSNPATRGPAFRAYAAPAHRILAFVSVPDFAQAVTDARFQFFAQFHDLQAGHLTQE
jgi:hypothetical protein